MPGLPEIPANYRKSVYFTEILKTIEFQENIVDIEWTKGNLVFA